MFTKKAQVILSPRGILIFIFSLYLAVFPATQRADLIASVISFSLLSMLLLIAIITILTGRALSNRLTLSFSPSGPAELLPNEGIIAGKEHRSLLKLSRRRLFPFFLLDLRPVFQYPGVSLPPFIVSGNEMSPSMLPLELRFPHRGIWKLLHVDCTLRDQFGFCFFKWKLECQHAYKVSPAPVQESLVPAISSCHKSGYTAVDITSRKGDPFDLKRYHPSDGVKKILWKVYAKSRELISRHPEASFTPEGQVALFVIADEHEDAPCSEAVAYMRMLQEMDLELFLGAKTFDKQTYASTAEQALDMLIESAWEKQDLLSSMQNYLEALRKNLLDSKLDRIILFLSKDRVLSAEKREELQTLAAQLSLQQIRPVFVISEGKTPRFEGKLKQRNAILAKLISMLVFLPEPQNPLNLQESSSFFRLCNRNNWEVILL